MPDRHHMAPRPIADPHHLAQTGHTTQTVRTARRAAPAGRCPAAAAIHCRYAVLVARATERRPAA
jgi:hypothetical protein